MADIRVEHKDREPNKGMSPWWWLLGAAVILGLILWPMMNRDNNETASNQTQIAAQTFQGEKLVPQNEVVSVPDEQMVRIGRSAEGRDIFGVREMAGGGGGQVADLNLPAHRKYLKEADGRYRVLAPDTRN